MDDRRAAIPKLSDAWLPCQKGPGPCRTIQTLRQTKMNPACRPGTKQQAPSNLSKYAKSNAPESFALRPVIAEKHDSEPGITETQGWMCLAGVKKSLKLRYRCGAAAVSHSHAFTHRIGTQNAKHHSCQQKTSEPNPDGHVCCGKKFMMNQ